MDGNRNSMEYSAHGCDGVGSFRTPGNNGRGRVCDGVGCRVNPYHTDLTFYGQNDPKKSDPKYDLDSNKPFTVVTEFL